MYTDCDVLFLKDFDLAKLKMPEYFSCSTQFTKYNFLDFNTGVMLMNVKKLRESHTDFVEFIKKNFKILVAFDQTAYQIYYHGKNTKLPIAYNHKPYWGVGKNAEILHFHGAKPTAFIIEDAVKHMPPKHYELYRKNPKAYDYYLNLFKKYENIEYNDEAIGKLKVGIFPINKNYKNPLNVRIMNKFSKIYQILKQR